MAMAQEFTTGANPDGYLLTGIELRLRVASGQSLPVVTLRSGSATGAVLATLTGSVTESDSIQDIAFAPSGAITLTANTSYWVVAEGGGGDIFRTDADDEDAGSADGWSIANDGQVRAVGSTSFAQGTTIKLQVNGTKLDPVLVSNIGQTAGTPLATTATYASYAQSFRTGSNPDGYYLTSVDLGLAAASGVTAKVELWWSGLYQGVETYDVDPRFGYRNYPGHSLAGLSAAGVTDDSSSTLERFNAHDVLLLPNVTYWIVVTRTAGAESGLSLATTGDATVDVGGLAGFSVGQGISGRDSTDLDGAYRGWEEGSARNMSITLRGTKATRPLGPYTTNRNEQTRTTAAETSATISGFATSFETWVEANPIVSTSSTYQLTSVLLSVAAESDTVPRVAIHADSNGTPAASPLSNGTLTAPDDIVQRSRRARPGRVHRPAARSRWPGTPPTGWSST